MKILNQAPAQGSDGGWWAGWWDAVLAGFAGGAPLHADPLTIVLIVAAAVALAVPRVTWRWFGLYVTFVHELGHALAAMSTGRIVRGIRLRLDHSGEMISHGRGTAGAAWAGFWGYPAPAVAGAALIWAGTSGWSGAALSVGALLLLVALVFIRNAAGMLVAIACAAVAQALVIWTPREAVVYVVLALGIALVVGSVKDWFKVARVYRRRGQAASSDAHILGRMTGTPALLWLAGFAAVIGGSAWASFAFLGGAVA
ncbi:MAG: M50 family metallopeptidase [Arthrobacter sp.]|uniref:M50 family metallopeptidase n=1 Tax=Arthrobacter sp. TaxID=1667 RepID=UPI0034778262